MLIGTKQEIKAAVMLLPPEEASLFISLYQSLIGYIAGRLGGVAGITDTATFKSASNNTRAKARDKFLKNTSLINDFIDENPDRFRQRELSHVAGFERFVKGNFIVERNLRIYTIFINDKSPPVAYGVLGLTDEIVDILPYPLPVMVSAVLLPWKGQIICDGLISIYNISFGRGIRDGFKESYRQAKAAGTITSL